MNINTDTCGSGRLGRLITSIVFISSLQQHFLLARIWMRTAPRRATISGHSIHARGASAQAPMLAPRVLGGCLLLWRQLQSQTSGELSVRHQTVQHLNSNFSLPQKVSEADVGVMEVYRCLCATYRASQHSSQETSWICIEGLKLNLARPLYRLLGLSLIWSEKCTSFISRPSRVIIYLMT
jgi:hypothetical protein